MSASFVRSIRRDAVTRKQLNCTIFLSSTISDFESEKKNFLLFGENQVEDDKLAHVVKNGLVAV